MKIEIFIKKIRSVCSFLCSERKKRIKVKDITFYLAVTDLLTYEMVSDPFWFGKTIPEENFAHHLVDNLKKCTSFIDVGANIGLFSVLSAKILDKKRRTVHAIEMDTGNVARLEASVQLNNLSNVRVHHAAIGDRSEMVNYFCKGLNTNTLKLSGTKEIFPTRSVSMMKLDDFIEINNIEPDIIKIDIEGAEYLALLGMTKILTLESIKIYCEVHLHHGHGSLSAFGHSIKDVFDLFKRHNFIIEQIGIRPNTKIKQSIVHATEDITESVMLYAHR